MRVAVGEQLALLSTNTTRPPCAFWYRVRELPDPCDGARRMLEQLLGPQGERERVVLHVRLEVAPLRAGEREAERDLEEHEHQQP